MNLTLIRSMTRSAVFELENELCYRPAHPFTVALNGKTVYEACNTNVFSLFSLLPGTAYTVEVQAEDETLKLDFTTEAETFFVDAARYGLVADGETDNTVRLQAALSTCPKGGTVYVPAGRYRTASLFMKSNTTLYLEKGAVLLGDNDRTHYPILPGVLPSENEVDEYYLTGWEGNPLDSFAGLLNITQVHDVVVTGEGTLDCDAENGDWWVNPKVKRIAWRPRAVAAVDSENVCLHGITVQNSYSWTIHPIFVKHLDLLNFNINNPYNAPNTDGIDPESCEYIRIIGMNIHVGDDCIAMKASKVFLGMKLKRSCEHTVIRNCLLDKGHGGIVIGSEMSGGVKDMVVTQCLMDHTDRGLRVKTRRGRGNTAVIDGLVFRNVEMRGVKAPFVINMFYFCDPDGHGPYVQCREPMPVDEYTPKLGSLTMENIVATDAQFAGCYFDGLPEQPIERVTMRDVSITFDPNAKEGQAVAPEYIESHLVEPGRNISVAECIVAHLGLVLRMECHGGRLQLQPVVAGIPVAVDSYLQVEHLKGAEVQKHTAVDAERRQRYHFFFRRGLIGDGIIPVPDAELQLLVKRGREYLHAAPILARQRL